MLWGEKYVSFIHLDGCLACVLNMGAEIQYSLGIQRY